MGEPSRSESVCKNRMTDTPASLHCNGKMQNPRAHSIARGANRVTLPNGQIHAYSISAKSADASHLDNVENAPAFGFRR